MKIETNIIVGSWVFYPQYMIAKNTHNGTCAYFSYINSTWVVECINYPSINMLKELINWFAKWINGKVS